MSVSDYNEVKHNYNKLILFFIQLAILGIGSNIIGPLIPILSNYFKVNLNLLGFTLSLNAFGILVISIFSGILSERFSKIKLFKIGNIFFIISFLGLFFSNNYLLFTICYLIYGFSWGIIYINSISIIYDFYRYNKTRIIIILNLGWMIGCLIGPLFVSGMLYLNMDWKYLFIIIMTINIFLFLIILFSKIKSTGNEKKSNNVVKIFNINKQIFKNSIIVFCGIIIFLQFGIGNIFQTWLATYFNNFNITLQISSLMLSLYMLFFCLGMIVKSFLIVKFNEKKVITFFSVLALIFLIISFALEWLFIKTIFILLFGFSISAISTTALSISIKENFEFPSLTASIMNTFGYLGIVIFQYSTGFLINKFSSNYLIIFSLGALFLLVIFTSLLNTHHSKLKSISSKI